LSDRRRLVVAVAITVIALPSLWLMSRSGSSGAPNLATAGVAIAPDGAGSVADESPVTSQPPSPAASPPTTDVDPMGSIPAAVVQSPPATAGSVAIAVPGGTDATFAVGDASYRSSIRDASTCIVRDAPFGTTVTVTNRNNNRSIVCRASVPAAGTDEAVVLATSRFNEIADLTDAPIPVDIDW
jgi:hypothetical protein